LANLLTVQEKHQVFMICGDLWSLEKR